VTARPSGQDPVVALTEVLSEVLDVIQDVKQAHRQVSDNHGLQVQLDLLFDDLRRWAALLLAEDKELGGSPLASIASAAGRTPPNLWTAAASDEDVRRTAAEHLERFAHHLSLALDAQDDDGARTLLEQIQKQLRGHLRGLRA
jgi:hypothetical protein